MWLHVVSARSFFIEQWNFVQFVLVADKRWSSGYIHILFQKIHGYSYSSIPFLAQTQNYKMIKLIIHALLFILQSYWSVPACEAQNYKMIKFIIVFILQPYWSVPACEINLNIHTWTWFLLTVFPQLNCCVVTGSWLREEPFHSVILPFCLLHKKTSTLQQCNSVLECKEMQLNWRPGTHLLGDLDYTS